MQVIHLTGLLVRETVDENTKTAMRHSCKALPGVPISTRNGVQPSQQQTSLYREQGFILGEYPLFGCPRNSGALPMLGGTNKLTPTILLPKVQQKSCWMKIRARIIQPHPTHNF